MEEALNISSAQKRSWIRRIPPEAWIFIFYLLVSVFLTWPLIIKFGSSIYGVPSDNMGSLWQFWWARNFRQFSASYSSCPLIGYPFGARFFAIPMEPVSTYFEYFLLLFLNEIVVYNITIFTSFVLSGITMYYLVRYLARDRRVAFFGGFAYLICTNHAFNAMYFVHLAIMQWMPLYILMLLRFIKKADWKSALWLTLSALLVAGTNVHYALFMAIFTVAFLFGRYVAKRFSLWREAGRQGVSSKIPLGINKNTMALSLLVLLVLIVFMTPFYFLPLSNMNPPGNWPTSPTPGQLRIEQYIEWNSAMPLEYVLPSTENPLLGKVTVATGKSRGSYSDSLYIGWSLIILAVIGVALFVKRRDKKNKPGDSSLGATNENLLTTRFGENADERRYIVWGFLLSAVVAFVLSLQPYMHIGSTKIPLPSSILMFLTPWFRWYMRMSIVLVICVIVLGCLGLLIILSKLESVYGGILLISLTVILSVEMLIVPPFRTVDVSTVPKVFEKIAVLPRDSTIAFYPLLVSGLFRTSTLQNYQRVFQKPMLNAAPDNSDGEALRRTVYNPYNDATPGILSRFNIRYMVLFRNQMPAAPEDSRGAKLPAGLQLVEKYENNGQFGAADIYRIDAHKANFIPLYLGDITVPQLDDQNETVRLMIYEGIIRILNFSGKDARVSIALPISNDTFAREFLIMNGTKTLWERRLAPDTKSVAEIANFTVPEKGLDLRLIVRGEPLRLPGDEIFRFGTTIATVSLGNLEVIQR